MLSNIGQVDGNDNDDNISSSCDDESGNDSSMTDFDTEDEFEPDVSPIELPPKSKPNNRTQKILKASSLPLVTLMNARSVYNKADNLKKFMNELGIEVAIISETWEREEMSLESLLKMNNYEIHSYKRPKVKAKRQPGGGCAIVYNKHRFKVEKLDVFVPKGVEACWIIMKPLNKIDLIENIAVGSIYVSPSSVYKTATINHIIDTIHLLRSQYDNRINYLIGGDLNRLKIDRILESYGSLRQIITSATLFLCHIRKHYHGFTHTVPGARMFGATTGRCGQNW